MPPMTPPRPAELPELLPCPFCGADGQFSGEKYPRLQVMLYEATCTNHKCPAWAGSEYGFGYNTQAEAITAWNTRAQAPKAGAVAWQDDVMAVIAEMRSTTIYTNQYGQDAIRSWLRQLETAIADEAPRPDWRYWYEKSEWWMRQAKRLGYGPPGDEATPPTQPEVRALVEAAKRLLREIDVLVSDWDGNNSLTDAGCFVCTLGTVPLDRDTGLCGYHATQAALSDLEKAE